MSKFHVYHQHDSMQCGIACLQMICKYHGKEYSQDTLSRYCFATNEGVSLLGISEAATRLGLHTTCGRVTTEQLHKAPLPCILHWNQNHFVVLYRIKKGKICYIADPGKGLVTYDDREFKEHWLSTRSNGVRPSSCSHFRNAGNASYSATYIPKTIASTDVLLANHYSASGLFPGRCDVSELVVHSSFFLSFGKQKHFRFTYKMSI